MVVHPIDDHRPAVDQRPRLVDPEDCSRVQPLAGVVDSIGGGVLGFDEDAIGRSLARLEPFELAALALIAPELPHVRLRATARADRVLRVVKPLSLGLLDGLAVPLNRLHRAHAAERLTSARSGNSARSTMRPIAWSDRTSGG